MPLVSRRHGSVDGRGGEEGARGGGEVRHPALVASSGRKKIGEFFYYFFHFQHTPHHS